MKVVGFMPIFVDVKKKFEITCFFYKAYNSKLPKNYVFSGERHDFWEVAFINKGQALYTKEENVYVLKPGDITFCSPMQFHRISTHKESALHLYNLSFKISGTLPDKLSDGFFSLTQKEQMEFMGIFEKIDHFLSSEECPEYMVQEATNRLENFISGLCENKKLSSYKTDSTSVQTYKTLIELMNDNVAEDLALEDFAKMCFISVSHIKSLFKKYAGISPKVYYNDLRVSKAQELLSQGLSVAHIAEMMSFSSPNYFSMFFKRNAGMTPQQYKKTLTS